MKWQVTRLKNDYYLYVEKFDITAIYMLNRHKNLNYTTATIMEHSRNPLQTIQYMEGENPIELENVTNWMKDAIYSVLYQHADFVSKRNYQKTTVKGETK